MLYREIIVVCSQIHTKHMNTLCGQEVKFVGVRMFIVHKVRDTIKGEWILYSLGKSYTYNLESE